MNIPLTCICAILLLPTCYGQHQENLQEYFSQFIADLWLEGADVIRIVWRDCSKKLVDVEDVIDHTEYFPKFVRCMKRKTLQALDRSLTPDVVPIGDGVSLVRFELTDPGMQENDTSTWSDKELDDSDWRTLALQRMAKVLRTHVIKFDFQDKKNILEKAEFRGRRRHHMLTMMMFGIVSIGMVVVPMGFQFLAVLGGKALLLAKMALIFASIQGLKKIVTSPMSYELYHSYPPPYDHYQKRSQDNWSSAALIPSMSYFSLVAQRPVAIDTGGNKIDNIHVYDTKNTNKVELTNTKNKNSKINVAKEEFVQRHFPVYEGIPETSVSIESLSPLMDSTTNPGEVEADFALDLPYNRIHFQSPSTVVST